MKKPFPEIKLGELLQRKEQFEEVDPLKEYHFAGIYSFGRGVFPGERKLGSSFKLPKVQKIHTGDFAYSKIMAWEGAFGIVPENANDCVMSGAFVLYNINTTLIDQRYLSYYFKVPEFWKTIGAQSTGTNVRRRSLHPQQFESFSIPLPPLEEQCRLVAHIEELAHKIEEAKRLRKDLTLDYEALYRSILFSTPEEEVTYAPLNELVYLREQDVTVNPTETYEFAGVYSFGRGVFRGQRKSGAEFAYTRLTRLHTNNFVYPKLMAWEGALGTVPPECDGLVVSPEFPVFEIDQTRVLPEVLDVYFRTPSIWPTLSGISTGTNVRRRRLNPSDFLSFKMPLPSMERQQLLKKVKNKIDSLKGKQAETEAELNVLLPSILDKAFQGEL